MSGIFEPLRFLLLFVLASSTAGYLLPLPLGKHNVTLATGPLTDYTRHSNSSDSPRELMISIFQPATCKHTIEVPYMPNKTASYQTTFLQEIFSLPGNFTPLFQDARLQVCPDHLSSWAPSDPPILLFSPGYSVNRLYYNSLASSIASTGFIVITIDHPDDANIITYPDGHAAYLDLDDYANTTEQYTKLQDARLKDISFLLDQLTNETAVATILPERGHRAFSLYDVGVFGHSLGGSTAINAAAQDARVQAAINFDGTIFGSPTTSKPVLLVSRDVSIDEDGFDPTRNSTWLNLKGEKAWTEVANTTHYAFSDFPTLLQSAGQNVTEYASLLGTVMPDEMVGIITGFTTSWMKGVFGEGLKKVRVFPQVSIVRSDLLNFYNVHKRKG